VENPLNMNNYDGNDNDDVVDDLSTPELEINNIQMG